MTIKVKRGAVKVGRKYIEAGETISGLSKEEAGNLVSGGTAEYVPEQVEKPETGEEKPKDEGDEETGGTADPSENPEKSGKGKAK